MNATATTAEPAAPDVLFKGRSTGVEWPTVALGIVILSAYVAITLLHDRMSAVATVASLAVVAAWWSSFQHELIHGHPFASQRVNDALGNVPIGLWLPYRTYKTLHLRHHRDPMLTDPREDPESFYVDAETWQRSGKVARSILWANRTFAWRLLVNPLFGIARFTTAQLRQLASGDRATRATWAIHTPAAAVVCVWAFGVARVPVWEYFLGSVWLATSLVRIRSFAEHRWTPEGQTRTAFVEGVFPFGLLFLFNNYHCAHHARPSVPWYQYPALALHLDSRTTAKAGAGYYRGYREVMWRYLVRPFDIPVHPPTELGRAMLQSRGLAPEPGRGEPQC